MVSVRSESFNTDVAFVLIGILNMLIRIWTNDINDYSFSPFWKGINLLIFYALSIFWHSLPQSSYVASSCISNSRTVAHSIMDF